jgi:hypothetical protein
MSATQTSKESAVWIHAKEYADDIGIDLSAYIKSCFHTSAEQLEDWQRVKVATDLYLFRKCKAFSDETQHYHPCQDCKDSSGAEQKDAMSSVMGFAIAVWKASCIRGKSRGATPQGHHTGRLELSAYQNLAELTQNRAHFEESEECAEIMSAVQSAQFNIHLLKVLLN